MVSRLKEGKKTALKNETGYWKRFWDERQSWTLWNWVSFYIPILHVLRTYNVKEWLIRDFLASVRKKKAHSFILNGNRQLSVTSMLVPQAVSYARLVGLPTRIGLYGAFVHVIFYAIFGTSRQLGVGPVAVTSLMFGEKTTALLMERHWRACFLRERAAPDSWV